MPRLARRSVIACLAALAAAPRIVFARASDTLTPTPRQSEGPFYPRRFPADADSDLVRVAGREARAEGVVTYIRGRVLDMRGRPLAGSIVEIWQCDARGLYHHVASGDEAARDPGFQGFGRAQADASGAYRFRTIRPVPYPGRTPHIHFAIEAPDGRRLVTQMYVAGEPGNARDGLLASVRDPAARARLLAPLAPAPELEPGALAGAFDIVLPG